MTDTRAPGRARGGTLDSLMPVVLFFALYNLVNVVAAVLAATAWSIKAAVSRRRRGLRIGLWLPGITVYLLARAAVTVAVEREYVDFGVSPEAVYFGIGFATKVGVGLVLAVTILVGRPFLAWVVPRIVHLGDELVADPRFVATMAKATWFVAGYEVVSAGWDVWLFNNSGFNVFYLARTGVNFVTSAICITIGLLYVDRELRSIDSYPGLVHLLERSGRGS